MAWNTGNVREGGYSWKYWIGHRIDYFPANLDELLTYDVVVLADLPQDPLTPEKRQMLADFVKQGGGLLVLGGPYAYGAGAWKDSPLEPLLPVQVGKAFDLIPVEGDARLIFTATGKQRLGKLPADLGIATWRHNATPRKGTDVWLTAGGQPFAVAGKAGNGRVIAILGAPIGEAPAEKTVCWESPHWAEFLVRVMDYLATGK